MVWKDMYPAFINSLDTTITVAISDTDTTITVADASKIPAAPNLLVLGGDTVIAETILMTVKNGNTLIVARGVQGTARAWDSGTSIARNFTAYDHDAFVNNINELNTGKTPNWAIVELEANQNLYVDHASTWQKVYTANFATTTNINITDNTGSYSYPGYCPGMKIFNKGSSNLSIYFGGNYNDVIYYRNNSSATSDSSIILSPGQGIEVIWTRLADAFVYLYINDIAYTLPTASVGILGGVKVGAGLTIADGVLSAVAPIATALTASSNALADHANKIVPCDNTSAITITVQPDSSISHPIGTTIVYARLGASGTTTVTFAAGSGVAIISKDSKLSIANAGSGATLIKYASDTWWLFGDLG
jgi:hypothetical protein